MQKIEEFSYGKFKTDIKITDEVRDFFESNEEKINLLDNFNSDEWYQGWLLKFLDKNKDGIPDEEFGSDFEMIFCSIIENPEDYVNYEDILEEFDISKDRYIGDGSMEYLEGKTRLWVRWIIIKK